MLKPSTANKILGCCYSRNACNWVGLLIFYLHNRFHSRF